jgi:hypothetical protein
MKIAPGKMAVVDAETGETKEVRDAGWKLMPPPAGACQVCGHNPAHSADGPHNAQSLYYQYAFFADHGRWPTWRDAIAHCAPPVKSAWEAELRKRGVWPPDEAVAT